MITQTYNIDLIPSGVPTIVHVSQYDSASRTIAMSIYDGGVAYDLTDKIVTVRGTKQDNTGFEYPCTVNGNVASFVLNAQMTIFDGDVPCEIRIAENGFVIGSHNFVLQVERTPLDSSIVISDTELPLIEGAEQNAIRAEQAADEAKTLLSTVVKSVNSVTPDAQGNVDIDASAIPYDNTSSGLSATDVQSAIDETSALGSTTLPLMDGTASVGTEQKYARGDHVHPTDTSRLGVNDTAVKALALKDANASQYTIQARYGGGGDNPAALEWLPMYNNKGDNLIELSPVTKYALARSCIRKFTQEINWTFTQANTIYYHRFDPSHDFGIDADNIINIGMVSFLSAWRILNFYPYGNNTKEWICVSNIGDALNGTIKIFYF